MAEESLFAFLEREIDSTPLKCGMTHPDPQNPGGQAIECHRTATWYATIHDCEAATKSPGAGLDTTICNDFLERAKGMQYPYRCPGCITVIGHFVHLIWNIEPINKPRH